MELQRLRYDEWVLESRAAIEDARRYAAAHGGGAFVAAVADWSAGKISERRRDQLHESLTLAHVEAALHAGHQGFEDVTRWEPLSRHLMAIRAAYRAMGHSAGVAETTVLQELLLNYQLAAIARAGRRVYEPSANLAEKLRYTLLKNYPTSWLRLPYPSVILAVPREAAVTVPDAEGRPTAVREIFITEETRPARTWLMYAIAPSETGEVRRPVRVPLEPHRLVEDAIAAVNAGTPTDALAIDVRAGREGLARPLSTSEHAAWELFFRWSMATIVYATSDEQRHETWANREARQLRDRAQKLPKGSKKRDELNARLRLLDVDRRIVLGPNVEPLQRPVGTTAQPLVVRTLVEGHFRQQPHGPGGSERKTIWIQPYWRGPDDALTTSPGRHVVK